MRNPTRSPARGRNKGITIRRAITQAGQGKSTSSSISDEMRRQTRDTTPFRPEELAGGHRRVAPDAGRAAPYISGAECDLGRIQFSCRSNRATCQASQPGSTNLTSPVGGENHPIWPL